jgi:hypothetical protein
MIYAKRTPTIERLTGRRCLGCGGSIEQAHKTAAEVTGVEDNQATRRRHAACR